MPVEIEVTYRVVTPLFCAGIDSAHPEIRLPQLQGSAAVLVACPGVVAMPCGLGGLGGLGGYSARRRRTLRERGRRPVACVHAFGLGYESADSLQGRSAYSIPNRSGCRRRRSPLLGLRCYGGIREQEKGYEEWAAHSRVSPCTVRFHCTHAMS